MYVTYANMKYCIKPRILTVINDSTIQFINRTILSGPSFLTFFSVLYMTFLLSQFFKRFLKASYLLHSLFFCAEPSSLLFAPSTIAIAALILSFSILRMDCTDWLRCIPNFCLLVTDNPLYNQDTNMRLFDIDGCLQSFKGVEANYSKKAVTKKKIRLTPSSIADSLLSGDNSPCPPSTSSSPPIIPSELRKRTRSLL